MKTFPIRRATDPYYRLAGVFITLLFLLGCSGEGQEDSGSLVYYGSGPDRWRARAVKVEGFHLAHTAQFLPYNSEGEIVGLGDTRVQVETVLDHLLRTLVSCETDFEKLVRINVYVSSPDVFPVVEEVFRDRLPERTRPAVTVVQTPLSNPDARVAMDAVAATAAKWGNKPVKNRPSESHYGEPGMTHVSILPEGPVVYISGQAEKGAFEVAVNRTLSSLKRTLEYLGLDLTRVVRMKVFMSPISSVPTMRGLIEDFFGKVRVPPLVFVEWKSPLPVEIELVAADEESQSRRQLTYLTPPDLSPSPVFSRVVRVSGVPMIYVSGLYGDESNGAEKEVRSLFASLEETLLEAGSDLRHLVKATYYVCDEEASGELNEVRKEVYDPERPPAASKAFVRGSGKMDRRLTIDMIAAEALDE